MTKPRPTSAVILITLAELAWLAAFGLLFAYRTKVGELGRISRDFNITSNKLAQWEARSPDVIDLQKQLDAANADKARLQEQAKVFDKLLAGASPAEAASRLAAAEAAEKRVSDMARQLEELRGLLEKSAQAESNATVSLQVTESASAKLRAQLASLPPNAAELATEFQHATNQLAFVEKQLDQTNREKQVALNEVRHLELGEFSVRRELTGLPDGALHRVIFLVDTSTSMRKSPAWASAKKLVRTWLEFLPVEECALVNFNDTAHGWPEGGYRRVRQADQKPLPDQRDELLRDFDRAGSGTYTDLLKGLNKAYTYPPADVMVLFTDGHPHVDYRGDASLAKAIYEEVAKHPGIPILTVALGSYETEGADGPRPKTNAPVAFLKELARRSGGNFLGR